MGNRKNLEAARCSINLCNVLSDSSDEEKMEQNKIRTQYWLLNILSKFQLTFLKQG